MANWTTSALTAYQAKLNKNFQKPEVRELQNPILRKASTYADFIIGDVNAIKQSDKRTINTYYKKRKAATNGTARALAPTGVMADSGSATLGWVTFSETMMLFSQTGADNVFGTQEMFEHQISELQRIIRERIGTYIVTQLHAARTQVTTSAGNTKLATWSVTVGNNAFEIASADANSFWQYAASVMRQNKYYGNLDAIADPQSFAKAVFLRNQGSSNSSNLSFQFSSYNPDGIMEHAVLGSTVTEEYVKGTALIMPSESFCIVPWIPAKNRQGWGDYETFNGGFGILADNTGLPITYAVRGWTQKADGSASGSVLQDVQLNIELSVDISFNVAPLSTATETPIYEFGQL